MENSLKYTVRIITNPNELTDALALRYKVYKNTFPKVVASLSQPFESDVYDHRSIHIGLYCEDLNGVKLVGYNRFILPDSLAGKYVDQLVTQHEKYPIRPCQSNPQNLHFESQLPEEFQSIVHSYCEELKRGNRVYIETGRFIIDDEHRSISISTFFSRTLIILSKWLKINFAFFTCDVHHSAFYKRQGLTPFSGIKSFNIPSFGNNFMIFGTDLDIFYKNSFNIVNANDKYILKQKLLAFTKAA